MRKTSEPGWFRDGAGVVNADRAGLARVRAQRAADRERRELVERVERLEREVEELKKR